MADEIVIGKIGLTPKGEYVSGELYDILDMVSHEGSSYVSKIQNNNIDVTNTEAWLLAAEKGDSFNFEVDTIQDLIDYEGTATTLIVKESLRGGLFNYTTETLEVDNGTIFDAEGLGSGYWVRQYDQEDGLNVLWYGADPTGVEDTADIIEQVIIDWSYKTGKVYIPKGTYRIESPIGKLVSGQPLPIRPITNDVEVIGQGAIIDVQPLSGRIGGAVSFSLDAVTVKFSGLVIQGNNNTNRGFYLRQQTPDFPTSEKSNIYIEGNKIYDILIQDGDIENSGIGVNIYGNMNSVIISDNIIENVTTDSETLVLKGIWIGGSASNGMSVNTEVFSNTVKNVSRSDDELISDQDGIHLAGVTRTFGERFGRVYNNTIINTRGRFIKAQHHSIEVYGNLLVFTSDYVPGEAKGAGIAILESDANVYNNTMILNSTHTNVSNTSLVSFNERSQDTNPHRLNVYGNKLVSVQPLEYFATIWEDGSAIMKGVYNVYANTVNCVLESGFVRHLTTGTYIAGERNINVFGNSMSDLQGVGVSFEPNTNPINVTFYNNFHSGATPVPVTNDELNNLVSFNNQGFTDVGLNLALRANGYQADVSSEFINLYGETEEDFVNINFPKDEIGEGERTIATREWVNGQLIDAISESVNQTILTQYTESTVSGTAGSNLIHPDLGLPILEVDDLQEDSSYSGELVLNIENNNIATAKVIELFGAEIYNNTNLSTDITTKITFTLNFFNQVGDDVDYKLSWEYLSSGEILFGQHTGTIDNTSNVDFELLVTGDSTDNFTLKRANLKRVAGSLGRVLTEGTKWHSKLTRYYKSVIKSQGDSSSVLPFVGLINQKLIENDGQVMFLTYENTTSLNLQIQTDSTQGWQVDWDGSGDWQAWNSSDIYITKTFTSPASGVAFIRSATGNSIEDINYIESTTGTWNFDISALSNVSYYARFIGDNMTLTGDISALSNVSYYVTFAGDNMTLTGDISVLSNVSNWVYFYSDNMTLTYTTTTWGTIPSEMFYLRLSSGHLTQPEVDQLFIDLNNAGTTGTAQIDLRWANAAPSAASASARTALASRGYNLLHN